MARKNLKEVGDTENKVRWNKKGTRKYELVTKLTALKPKTKKKKATKSTTAKAKPKSKKKSTAKTKSKKTKST